jgi:hypothetical protein
MELINNLYYCGRGDVDTYIVEWSQAIHFKILACSRLKLRYERHMDKLNGVVGKS